MDLVSQGRVTIMIPVGHFYSIRKREKEKRKEKDRVCKVLGGI